MKLKDIIENLDGVERVNGDASMEIKGLSCDSKRVKEGYLFIAVRGSRFNGADFIDEAIDRLAGAVLLESDSSEKYTSTKDITFIYVESPRRLLPEIAKRFYRDISSAMSVIGVTGTNGKTTITYLLEGLFKTKNEKTGVIGTINYRFGDRLIPSLNTTPGVLDIYSFLSSMNAQNIGNCIIEASSHALDQGRVDSLSFDIAIFTNLTSEHLDYHKNLEDYFSSKIKLFTKIKKGGFAVINKDDPYSEKIIERVKIEDKANIITYGIKKGPDVYAEDVQSSFEGLKFKLCLNDSSRLIRQGRTRSNNIYSSSEVEKPVSSEVEKNFIEINSSLIGCHNAYNILASACCGIAMGMKKEDIKSGIEGITTLPGRLERIDCGQDFLVFVDYAHTENGLENVLNALKELKPKRLLSVFGCGGDRDRSKRPNMGRLSSELSTRIFITSDNPRNEEPMGIINEIKSGISPEKDNYVIEVDRFKAIKRALKEAREGDIVLVAGKGHETYQVFKNTTIPFDDREAIRKILKEKKPCLQSETP